MNSLPPERRGAGAGRGATFQNSPMGWPIGIFFTLIILGLASSLPATLNHGLVAQGLPAADASRLASLPPVWIMFAALLGYNPIRTLLGPALSKLPAGHAAYLTGHSFFPSLISGPFSSGLHIAFDFAIAACLIAAVASLLRGKKYVHDLDGVPAAHASVAAAAAEPVPVGTVPAGPVPVGTVPAGPSHGDGAHAGGGYAARDVAPARQDEREHTRLKGEDVLLPLHRWVLAGVRLSSTHGRPCWA